MQRRIQVTLDATASSFKGWMRQPRDTAGAHLRSPRSASPISSSSRASHRATALTACPKLRAPEPWRHESPRKERSVASQSTASSAVCQHFSRQPCFTRSARRFHSGDLVCLGRITCQRATHQRCFPNSFFSAPGPVWGWNVPRSSVSKPKKKDGTTADTGAA